MTRSLNHLDLLVRSGILLPYRCGDVDDTFLVQFGFLDSSLITLGAVAEFMRGTERTRTKQSVEEERVKDVWLRKHIVPVPKRRQSDVFLRLGTELQHKHIRLMFSLLIHRDPKIMDLVVFKQTEK